MLSALNFGSTSSRGHCVIAYSLWKFADDTTVSEIVPNAGASMLQHTVHNVLLWSSDKRFKLNLLKCNEIDMCTSISLASVVWFATNVLMETKIMSYFALLRPISAIKSR